MPQNLDGQLVVAISSRALFDFEEANQIFESEGPQAYMKFQLDRLDQTARPGVAFPLVKKLLAFNAGERKLVEVVILSRNDPVSGLRVFHSAQEAGLQLERGVFINGRAPFGYLSPLGATLFLSANEEDVRSALGAGFPAARVYVSSSVTPEQHESEIRIAFDGDAVLFSDQAEQVYQSAGIEAFQQHERERVAEPLPPGPFKPLLNALQLLQAQASSSSMRIRTALVTARSAPAHERAVRTLMNWNIVVDEALFLGGLDKAAFLKVFEPDFFFDDQTGYCESASQVTPTGQVISGIKNRTGLG